MMKEKSQRPNQIPQTIIVAARDSLPILSERVYGTPEHTELLTGYNNLNKFRHPKPGTELVFPPIMQGD